MAGPYVVTRSHALGAPAAGVNLLISGAWAFFLPRESIPDADVHSSQPYAVLFGFLILAIPVGLLAAAYQEPFLALTNRSPQTIDSPVSAVVFWPLVVFAGAYILYYLTKFYLMLTKRILRNDSEANIYAPSFIYSEFAILWSVAIAVFVLVFGLQEYFGTNSATYFLGFAVGIVVSSRVYRVSLRLRSYWTAFVIAGVQAGLLLLMGVI